MQNMRKISAAVMALGMSLSLMSCGMFTEIEQPGKPSSSAESAADSTADNPAQTTDGTVTTAAPVTLPTTEATTEATTAPPAVQPAKVHVLAVGDNLVQTGVYNAAKRWSSVPGSYDFTKTYENIVPLVQAADVAIINQETLICGEGYEVSGADFNFNSPPELGTAMVKAGFDVFTLANNHVRDKGVDGLKASLDYWDSMMEQYPILAVGVYRSKADQSKIRVQEVNGLKIAYLAYTEHMNGYTIPDDAGVVVGLTSEEALIKKQIEEAHEIADAVIVAAHWGNEDTHTVRDDVKALAKKMVDWGADVILGSHPHTAQTMEYLTRSDGTRGFVFYSLGNFISAQTDNFNVVGEMGEFDLVLDETGKLSVEDVTCMPVITHYDDAAFSNLRLYPYDLYTPQLAASHGLPYAPMGTAKSFSMDVIDRIVEANFPAEFRKLKRDAD